MVKRGEVVGRWLEFLSCFRGREYAFEYVCAGRGDLAAGGHTDTSAFGETQPPCCRLLPPQWTLTSTSTFFIDLSFLSSPRKSVKPYSMQTFSKSFLGTLDKISSISFSSVTFFCFFLGAGGALGGRGCQAWTEQLPLKTKGTSPNLEMPMDSWSLGH